MLMKYTLADETEREQLFQQAQNKGINLWKRKLIFTETSTLKDQLSDMLMQEYPDEYQQLSPFESDLLHHFTFQYIQSSIEKRLQQDQIPTIDYVRQYCSMPEQQQLAMSGNIISETHYSWNGIEKTLFFLVNRPDHSDSMYLDQASVARIQEKIAFFKYIFPPSFSMLFIASLLLYNNYTLHKQGHELQNQFLTQQINYNQIQIEQLQDRMIKIFTHSPEGIFLVNLNDRSIVDVNPAACKMLGFSKEELLNKKISDIHPDEMDQLLKFGQEVLEKQSSWTNELSCLTKSGFRLPAEVSAARITVDHTPCMLAMVRDVTEQTEIKKQLMIAKTKAEHANQAKTAFLSSMSHELRTPLNAVLGFAQLLQVDVQHPLSPSQQESVEYILKSGNHLLQLINEILQLSKIERGKIDISLEPVNPVDLMDECVAVIRSLAESRSISVENKTESIALPVIDTDIKLFKQIFLNLLTNAVKYNQTGGKIVVDALILSDQLRIQVKDTGKGISLEYQDKVFSPFERLGLESSEIEGTGIGLSISKQLVELMGGQIGFESVPNEGSVFWFQLPLTASEVQEELTDSVFRKETSEPIAKQRLCLKSAAQETEVLYIEDNPINIRLMQSFFRRLEHVKLTTAMNAETGIEIAKAKPPHLIIMDISLPGISGIEATRILKSSPALQHIPIIAVTAAAMNMDITNAMLTSFADYITKPVEFENLLKIMQAQLETLDQKDSHP